MPAMSVTTAACHLLVGKDHRSFFNARSCGLHRKSVGRSYFRNVVKLAFEERAAKSGVEFDEIVAQGVHRVALHCGTDALARGLLSCDLVIPDLVILNYSNTNH